MLPFFRGSSERQLFCKSSAGKRPPRNHPSSTHTSRADWTHKHAEVGGTTEDFTTRSRPRTGSRNTSARTFRTATTANYKAVRVGAKGKINISKEKVHEILLANVDGKGKGKKADAAQSKYANIVRTIFARGSSSKPGSDKVLGLGSDSNRHVTIKLDNRKTEVNKVVKPIVEQQQFLAVAQQMHHSRLRFIYEDVLYKTGKDSAKKLFKDYFGEGGNLACVEEIEKDTERRKEEQLLSGAYNCDCNVKDWRRLGNRSQSSFNRRRKNETPTPSQKHERAKKYGRWYLEPRNFSDRLKVG